MTRHGWPALVLLLAGGLTGCRHKTPPPVVPVPPATTVPVATAPDTAEIVPTLPIIPVPLTPIEVPTKKVKKHRKTLATASPNAPLAPGTLPPAGMASASSPSAAPPAPAPGAVPDAGAAVIGALTPGGDESSEKYRQARDLISGLDRQISGLPSSTQQDQKEQIARIVHFNQEAQRALRAGDADGAVTLATKAKLLLDDLLK